MIMIMYKVWKLYDNDNNHNHNNNNDNNNDNHNDIKLANKTLKGGVEAWKGSLAGCGFAARFLKAVAVRRGAAKKALGKEFVLRKVLRIHVYIYIYI